MHIFVANFDFIIQHALQPEFGLEGVTEGGEVAEVLETVSLTKTHFLR